MTAEDVDDVEAWWAERPMTYGDVHGATRYAGTEVESGSPEFFRHVDSQFYAWNTPLHSERPFDRIFPYDRYADRGRVLEIGCGMGTMASNWAAAGARVTAVDLNPVAVALTTRRAALVGLHMDVRQADARGLPFEDGSFDYVYSWGVLHHSPDLPGSLTELFRVLKPGGEFGVMVYHRRSFLYRYLVNYVEGFLHMESRFLDEYGLASRYGDGDREEGNPHTWPVTRRELSALVGRFSSDDSVRVLGTDLDYVFRLMLPGLGMVLPRWGRKPWARRFGWSLWASGSKR